MTVIQEILKYRYDKMKSGIIPDSIILTPEQYDELVIVTRNWFNYTPWNILPDRESILFQYLPELDKRIYGMKIFVGES